MISGNGTVCFGYHLFWLSDVKPLKVKVHVYVFLAKLEREMTEEKSHFYIICTYVVGW